MRSARVQITTCEPKAQTSNCSKRSVSGNFAVSALGSVYQRAGIPNRATSGTWIWLWAKEAPPTCSSNLLSAETANEKKDGSKGRVRELKQFVLNSGRNDRLLQGPLKDKIGLFWTMSHTEILWQNARRKIWSWKWAEHITFKSNSDLDVLEKQVREDLDTYRGETCLADCVTSLKM